MRKPLLKIFGVIFVLLAGYTIYLLNLSGEFKSIEPHFSGSCRAIQGVSGPEDIQILADGSGAFLTSQDRGAHLRGQSANGTIYYYDLTRPSATPINVLPDAPGNFHPHGLALFETSQSTSLFVVNHPRGDVHGDLPGKGPAHTIEVYDVSDTTLIHRESISDPELLITPNDIAPISETQFYVTNDHGTGDKFWRKVENYLRQRKSHVLFYDGKDFSRLPHTFGYANGIAASRDSNQIFVASPTDLAIYIFDRDWDTGALNPAGEIDLGTAPDNINVDTDGNLWIGAHPKMLTLSLHLEKGQGTSPSQVLKIDLSDQDQPAVEEVFLSDGKRMAASTSAAQYGNRLLIGAVFGDVFLDCQMAK